MLYKKAMRLSMIRLTFIRLMLRLGICESGAFNQSTQFKTTDRHPLESVKTDIRKAGLYPAFLLVSKPQLSWWYAARRPHHGRQPAPATAAPTYANHDQGSQGPAPKH